MFGAVSELELLACYVQEKGEQQTFKQDKCSLSIMKFLDTYFVTKKLQNVDCNLIIYTSKPMDIIKVSTLSLDDCNHIINLLVTLNTFGNGEDYITSFRGLYFYFAWICIEIFQAATDCLIWCVMFIFHDRGNHQQSKGNLIHGR